MIKVKLHASNSLFVKTVANSKVPQNTELFMIDIAASGIVTIGSTTKSQTMGWNF